MTTDGTDTTTTHLRRDMRKDDGTLIAGHYNRLPVDYLGEFCCPTCSSVNLQIAARFDMHPDSVTGRPQCHLFFDCDNGHGVGWVVRNRDGITSAEAWDIEAGTEPS